MPQFAFSTFLVFVPFVLASHSALAQSSAPAAPPTPLSSKSVSSPSTTNWTTSTLPKTLEAVSNAYKVTIVCDAFNSDFQSHPFPKIDPQTESSALKALQNIAANQKS